MNNEQHAIAEAIMALATTRGTTKTICPSEAARKLWPDDWRKHMQDVRTVAFDLSKKGQVRIMQKENTILEQDVKGPIRIQIL